MAKYLPPYCKYILCSTQKVIIHVIIEYFRAKAKYFICLCKKTKLQQAQIFSDHIFCCFYFVFGHSISQKIIQMRRQKSHPYKTNDLTLSFGQFVNPRMVTIANPFQRVKSQMLKRRQKFAIRKKPLQYQKLQMSLQEKLKQKSFNAQQQRDQLVMLEKCKNYFQLRRNKSPINTVTNFSPKASFSDIKVQPGDGKVSLCQRKRPQTTNVSVRNSIFFDKLKNVMDNCIGQQGEMKQNMGLFTFYCKMMDRRLQGIKNTIQKKQRMI